MIDKIITIWIILTLMSTFLVAAIGESAPKEVQDVGKLLMVNILACFLFYVGSGIYQIWIS